MSAALALDVVVPAVRESLALHGGEIDVPRVAAAAREHGLVLDPTTLVGLTEAVRDHLQGLGQLEHHARGDVTDILVNPDGSVWTDGPAGLRRTGDVIGPAEARALAVRLATSAGRRLDDASPCVDAQLPHGIRLHAVLPPLTGPGTVLSLRRPGRTIRSLDDLALSSGLAPQVVGLLDDIVRSRCAFVVSGGTGTGKTTLLAALLARADAAERIVVVEDARELRISHPHVVSLQARHPNVEGAGGIDLRTLVRQCLRMRPDRIVVGECRGAEVRELLQALNTGHEGGCGTLHANTAQDVPARLEALGALGGLDARALATQAASALDLIIHLERDGARRRPAEIALLERDADGLLTAVPAVDLRVLGRGVDDSAFGPGWAALRTRLARGRRCAA